MCDNILFFQDPLCDRQTEVLQLCFNIIFGLLTLTTANTATRTTSRGLQRVLTVLLVSQTLSQTVGPDWLEHVYIWDAAPRLQQAGVARPEKTVWPDEKGNLATMETVAT